MAPPTAPGPTTAAVLIVGNEILRGATRDANAYFLARRLSALGIELTGITVIPDDMQRIADAVSAQRKQVDCLLVCGGIGPTHDDMTREAVARGLGRRCVPHPEAEKILRAHYGDRINDERLSMACLPEGSTLIPNPLTGAPGFAIGNVFVLPGIPSLVETMFETLVPSLATRPAHTVVIRTRSGEGDFAGALRALQREIPGVVIGSYPATTPTEYEQHRARIVVHAADRGEVEAAATRVRDMLEALAPGSVVT